jgi:cytochrome c553
MAHMTSIRDRRAAVLRLAVSHPWLAAAALLLGVVAIAAVTVISGIAPIGASSGHWRITAAILDFAKVRSVSTHAWGIDVPPLEDEALVLRGAGHYEAACLPCHGGPGRRMLAVMAAMTPHPPDLRDQLSRWRAEELFSIVKHGIKFTGMPAWPAQNRDDEVLAVVAFLLELPRLDAAGYRKLVYGEVPARELIEPLQELAERVPAPRAVALTCARCHGADGLGRELAAFPKLAGQKREYLARTLDAYARGKRPSGMMEPIAVALGAEERSILADYYSSLEPEHSRAEPQADAVARGAQLATHGHEAQGVPSCMDCHGPGGHARNPSYPNLAGQHAAYLAQQLELFQSGQRGGSSFAHLMAHVAPRLSPVQRRDVAAYYASLPGMSAQAQRD